MKDEYDLYDSLSEKDQKIIDDIISGHISIYKKKGVEKNDGK